MKTADLFSESIDIFVSIHPVYADKILDGIKTIELRRRFPSLNGFSGRLLIYSTSPVQSVIGFAEIKDVHHLPVNDIWTEFKYKAKVEKASFFEYFTGTTHGYAIELENPRRFPKPISMEYLKETYGMIAPQSYRYLKEEHEALFSYAEREHKNTSGYKYPNPNRRQQAN